MTYLVAAFYKFSPLNGLEVLRKKLLDQAQIRYLKGTLLIAPEGINATLCGPEVVVKEFLSTLGKEQGLEDIQVKYSWCPKQCFHRLKVRIKAEIVTIGITELDPTQQVGNYVKPEKWDELINQPNTLVIDTRNNYEISVGSFPGAIDPGLNNFRQFPTWVNQHLKPLMEQNNADRLALFCTGGIRCEKATSYLLAQGFKDVYHLEGGILKYLEQIPPQSSNWQGECFVFDQRVALNHQLNPGKYSLCFACGMPLSSVDRALPSYVEGIKCPFCEDSFNQLDRQRFADRQQQMQLAAARGEQHIGTRTLPDLAGLESYGAQRGLLLRLQVKNFAGFKIFRVGVARREAECLILLGELKGWALPVIKGLQLDTMRVHGNQIQGVGDLIWAATFAWALEQTPCKVANILAIRDNEKQHRSLLRYFRRLSFSPKRELGAGLFDLPLRLVWGGAGLLMVADCAEGFRRSCARLGV